MLALRDLARSSEPVPHRERTYCDACLSHFNSRYDVHHFSPEGDAMARKHHYDVTELPVDNAQSLRDALDKRDEDG